MCVGSGAGTWHTTTNVYCYVEDSCRLQGTVWQLVGWSQVVAFTDIVHSVMFWQFRGNIYSHESLTVLCATVSMKLMAWMYLWLDELQWKHCQWKSLSKLICWNMKLNARYSYTVKPLILSAINLWLEQWDYFGTLNFGIFACSTTSNTASLTEYWIFVARYFR